jgi:hypothetical protein
VAVGDDRPIRLPAAEAAHRAVKPVSEGGLEPPQTPLVRGLK